MLEVSLMALGRKICTYLSKHNTITNNNCGRKGTENTRTFIISNSGQNINVSSVKLGKSKKKVPKSNKECLEFSTYSTCDKKHPIVQSVKVYGLLTTRTDFHVGKQC